MATAKMPVRLKGQTTCNHHIRRQLDFYCEQCQEPVCPKCVTSLHKGHLFCDLSEITPQRKKKIKNFIDQTEQNVLQDIGNYIASTYTLLTENDKTFEKFSDDLKAQTQRLKQDLDMLTEETLSLYNKMKHDNTKLIQAYKQDLEMFEKQLKQQMRECKNVLQQGSHIEIYDTECEIDFQIHLPLKPMLGTVSFTPNTTPRNYLGLALGTCESDHSEQTSALTVKDRPVSLSHGHVYFSTQESSGVTRKKAVTRTKLLTETKVVEEWKSPCAIAYICPTNDGQAWTCSDDSKTLTLIDTEGIVMEVKTKYAINDISLSPVTQRLWACDRDKTILELVSEQLSVRFRTKDKPRCICVTADNHILIGMPKHITKYNTQGQVVLTTEATGTATPLLCSPWRITECPITNNVAVVDHSNMYDGGDANAHVFVMDTDFQELFMYRGSIPRDINKQQTAHTEYEPFDPRDIVFDSQRNIVTADCGNERILILSGHGEVLMIMYGHNVYALGVTRQDDLWTVDCDGNVTLLHYYEQPWKTAELMK